MQASLYKPMDRNTPSHGLQKNKIVNVTNIYLNTIYQYFKIYFSKYLHLYLLKHCLFFKYYFQKQITSMQASLYKPMDRNTPL
jgi:hypothetical protein